MARETIPWIGILLHFGLGNHLLLLPTLVPKVASTFAQAAAATSALAAIFAATTTLVATAATTTLTMMSMPPTCSSAPVLMLMICRCYRLVWDKPSHPATVGY